jgi:GNAT superfamily N-acetyltransferase
MADLALRNAAPDDVPALLRLLRDLAAYEKLPHEVQATEEHFQRALFGGTPRIEALMADWRGEPVGFAVWFYTFSTFDGWPKLYVEDVFVAPEQRGRGIGRAIFADLARRALAQGCGRMEWSVLDWNAPSIGFYRSIGAEPREGWTVQRLSGAALRALAA